MRPIAFNHKHSKHIFEKPKFSHLFRRIPTYDEIGQKVRFFSRLGFCAGKRVIWNVSKIKNNICTKWLRDSGKRLQTQILAFKIRVLQNNSGPTVKSGFADMIWSHKKSKKLVFGRKSKFSRNHLRINYFIWIENGCIRSGKCKLCMVEPTFVRLWLEGPEIRMQWIGDWGLFFCPKFPCILPKTRVGGRYSDIVSTSNLTWFFLSLAFIHAFFYGIIQFFDQFHFHSIFSPASSSLFSPMLVLCVIAFKVDDWRAKDWN